MAEPRPDAIRSLARSLRSPRTAAVALMSFSSGMPLGLVWIAIPDWLRKSGFDLETIGLITLAQAPWTFKFLWSPFLDRYPPPFLGRRRGWILLAQVALAALTFVLAGVGDRPESAWVVGALALAIGFAAASQDIAYDAYAVDVLRPEEQGVAVGARTALYRAGMYMAGALAITLASKLSWAATCLLLGALYLPAMAITFLAPEPSDAVVSPRTLREALWLPFVGFLARHRSLEILAFVLCYKFADNLAGALLRPFLVDKGYGDFDRGVALGTVAMAATIAGTFLGGAATAALGLGHSLWIFGLLQIFSNVGYVLLSTTGPDRVLMYGAMGFESFTQGLGSGAFSVLLLRLTMKRFSATQFALFSSLFGLPRLASGPIAGVAATGLGWTTFFWITMVVGIPGLVLLARFVPIGVREPEFTVEAPGRVGPPLTRGAMLARGMMGALAGAFVGSLLIGLFAALRALRNDVTASFDIISPLLRLLAPSGVKDWVQLFGLVAFAAVCALFAAAYAEARHGGAEPS